MIEDCVRTLAKKHGNTRFVRLHYQDAEMEPAGVPAIIAYRGGEKFGGLVPVMEEMPDDAELSSLTLEAVMLRYVGPKMVYLKRHDTDFGLQTPNSVIEDEGSTFFPPYHMIRILAQKSNLHEAGNSSLLAALYHFCNSPNTQPPGRRHDRDRNRWPTVSSLHPIRTTQMHVRCCLPTRSKQLASGMASKGVHSRSHRDAARPLTWIGRPWRRG